MYEELVKRLRRYVEIERSEHHGAELEAESANAIEELRKPKWIPVTERLPEKHQWCLVVGENLYDMDFINSRGVWTIHDKPYAPIAYWMPLPEPPKEET